MTKIKLSPFLITYSKQHFCRKRFLSNFCNKDDAEKCANSVAKKNDKNFDRPMYVPPPDELPPNIEEIEEPTTCCMSGCSNCVWIEYAEKLSKVMKNSQGDVQKIIMDKVQDPNMRAFLSMELRIRKIGEET